MDQLHSLLEDSARCDLFRLKYTYHKLLTQHITDYIFILDPPDKRSVVIGLSRPHRTEDLDPGLPRKGVCGSDHISLSAEIML